MEIPAEILKKVKLLEIHTRKIVNNQFAGEYHTKFKGQGMTFADFREYVPGDDVRSISWALTARAGKPYIKKFDEEREMTVILAVDISGSTNFGSGETLKGEALINIAALIAFSASKNKDQVGLLLFSDRVEHFVPPGKGKGHIHRILRDLYYIKPKSEKTQLAAGLNYLQGILKKKSAIFILSDFMDKGFETSLKFLGKKHDVLAILAQDKNEMSLPDLGLVDFEDSETGEIVTVDTASKEFRLEFERSQLLKKENRKKLLRQSQVQFVEVSSSQDYVAPIISYFRRR